jgi:hypothetical protein
VHHAASIAAVGKSKRMSQLVHDLFDDPSEESLRICASMQAMQTDHSGTACRGGDTEDKVEIAGVAVGCRDGNERPGRHGARCIEQHLCPELGSLGIIRTPWAQDGSLESHPHTAGFQLRGNVGELRDHRLDRQQRKLPDRQSKTRAGELGQRDPRFLAARGRGVLYSASIVRR